MRLWQKCSAPRNKPRNPKIVFQIFGFLGLFPKELLLEHRLFAFKDRNKNEFYFCLTFHALSNYFVHIDESSYEFLFIVTLNIDSAFNYTEHIK